MRARSVEAWKACNRPNAQEASGRASQALLASTEHWRGKASSAGNGRAGNGRITPVLLEQVSGEMAVEHRAV
jgi:hypothetical protein